jgi:hypothetical protein
VVVNRRAQGFEVGTSAAGLAARLDVCAALGCRDQRQHLAAPVIVETGNRALKLRLVCDARSTIIEINGHYVSNVDLVDVLSEPRGPILFRNISS